jgi:lipopolysaccharide assembly protein A
MKGQWGLILSLFLALIIAILSVVNVNSVTFNYVFGETKWPLILIILGSVFMGALAVGLFGLVKVYHLRKQVKRLEKELAAQKQLFVNGKEEDSATDSDTEPQTVQNHPDQNELF